MRTMQYLHQPSIQTGARQSLCQRLRATILRGFRGQGASLAALGLACAALAPVQGYAQEFPSQPIRITVGYGPGGGTDTIARFYADKLGEILNTTLVVENKPGAAELLAALPVMRAKPDGYYLWMGTGGALVQNPGVRTDLPYDILRDFTPVALIAEAEAIMLVTTDVPVNTLAELIAYGKANPGKLNYGSGGIGAGNHLWMEYLIGLTGAQFTHIPYKSEVEITRDIMGGNVDLTILPERTALPLIQDGKAKAIAVTGSQRLASVPNVPSFAETTHEGTQIDGSSYTFFAIMGPKGMPASVVQKINAAFNQASEAPEVNQRMRQTLYMQPRAMTPDAYRQILEGEVEKWRVVGQTVKIEASQ